MRIRLKEKVRVRHNSIPGQGVVPHPPIILAWFLASHIMREVFRTCEISLWETSSPSLKHQAPSLFLSQHETPGEIPGSWSPLLQQLDSQLEGGAHMSLENLHSCLCVFLPLSTQSYPMASAKWKGFSLPRWTACSGSVGKRLDCRQVPFQVPGAADLPFHQCPDESLPGS